MSGLRVILGYGAVGKATARLLLARGATVRVAQRIRPADLPTGCAFVACDVTDPASVRAAIDGASQVLLAVGITYDARIWRAVWPAAMRNVLAACAAVDARLVFLDNLYQLGPQTRPRTEDMPLTTKGGKPAILAEVTRLWQTEAAAGRVRVAALRCPDFYGPGVGNSHIGATGLGAMARGKPALLIAPPDTPHDFAYVPDIARAAVALMHAPDDDYGQVWNMPSAPTRTPREILGIGADALGIKLKVQAIPLWSLSLVGLVSTFMREVADVGFTWDRPYHVDAGKFTRRFAFDTTPFEIGVPETVRSFQAGGA